MIRNFIINQALEYLSLYLRSIGLPALCEIMPAFGKVFGPTGCRHFTELSIPEQEQLLIRVPALHESRKDVPKAFRWLPGWFYCYTMPGNQPPAILVGTSANEDIPERGTWGGTEGYLAATLTTGLHIRGFFRWNQNTRLLEFPSFTVKQLH